VPLTHVNQQLRDTLICDNGLWLLLLRTRLNTKLSGESKNNAFQELLRRLPTLHCSNCLHMELRRHPFFDPFWNRPMCDRCRFAEKYRLITAYTAKKHYFLNENDLLDLKTISKENPHSKTAGHARYFSRGSVIKKSDLKRKRIPPGRNNWRNEEHEAKGPKKDKQDLANGDATRSRKS
jgi:XPA protein C-terminus